MSKHQSPKSHSKPVSGLQNIHQSSTSTSKGAPKNKPNDDPTKGLRNALKIKDIAALAQAVAMASGGG